jgi:hypothetical protein
VPSLRVLTKRLEVIRCEAQNMHVLVIKTSSLIKKGW